MWIYITDATQELLVNLSEFQRVVREGKRIVGYRADGSTGIIYEHEREDQVVAVWKRIVDQALRNIVQVVPVPLPSAPVGPAPGSVSDFLLKGK